METTISVRLEKPILKDIEQIGKSLHTDRSEVIRRLLASATQEWKINEALQKLAAHKISIGKAAEECNLTIWDMLELVKKHNINWTGYSSQDLERDLELL
ncbi:MAG TPA: UPF0175 family protein [Candidatus Nanoarchaeia archaeon]|nr:UPF0175 family protein [Candidatus Nanoarchaeia archaeon]